MRRFGLTYDYRCPYARIAHDHVVTALRAGAPFEVTFLPFSLGQAHVEDGEPDVWDAPESDSGLLALQVSIAVRDGWPERFLDVHADLFELRHTHAGSLRDREVLAGVLERHGLDAAAVFGEVDSGRPLATIRDEHTAFASTHAVWGVPTFVVDDKAVFVRLLDRSDGDGPLATATVHRIIDQIEWPILNEFKHTSVPR
jgi:DSBA-like thioredoxin domain